MADTDRKVLLAVAAGMVIGFIAMKLYSNTQHKVEEVEKKEKHEEVKEPVFEHKTSIITKRDYEIKFDRLKKISQKFIDGLAPKEEICISRVPHLAETHDVEIFQSPLLGDISVRDSLGVGRRGFLPEKAFSSAKKFVLAGQSYKSYDDMAKELKFLRAGPRKEIVFNPTEVKAAIVTCGGLCPGMNVVIRELVMALWFNYGVRSIFGVQWGFMGFHDSKYIIELTPQKVKHLHHLGGSWLGSSRGGFDAKVIINACKEKGINQLYVIGGDGTHKAAYALYEYVTANKDKIVVCGVPKTIDNDIPLIDKSFGFDSAVEAAELMIEAANVEAESAQYGVGLVKLMGRDCGYIAANATLSSRDVNFCLIPESPFEIEGDYGLCENVCHRLLANKSCVIVVAEGADESALDVKLERDGKTDGGGHVKHADIGVYLKNRIVAYAKEKYNIEVTLKYIDPTYAVRSVPANSGDKIMCSGLSQGSVNAAMAGYTGFSIGSVKGSNAIIPIRCINMSAKRRISLLDREWQRVLASTGQSQLVSPEKMPKVLEMVDKQLNEVAEKYKALVEEQIEMSLMMMEKIGDENRDKSAGDVPDTM